MSHLDVEERLEHLFGKPPVHVHVDNADDLKNATKVEEVEPEHFVTSTLVLLPVTNQLSTGQGTGRNDIAQVLDVDLKRKSAACLVIDTAVVFCDSYRKAQDTANQTAGVPFPQGAYVPAGGSWAADGTGPLWVVNTIPGTPCRVSVTINRRA
jgi:hypothetical protein